jgi:hypothetical protein
MEWKMVHLLTRFQCLTSVTVVGTVAGCGRRCGGAGFCVKHGVGAGKQRTGGALVRRIALITASRCLQTRRGQPRRRAAPSAHPWRRLDQLRQKHHAGHGQLPRTSRLCRLLRGLPPLCGRQELMAGSTRRRAACRALDTRRHGKVRRRSQSDRSLRPLRRWATRRAARDGRYTR